VQPGAVRSKRQEKPKRRIHNPNIPIRPPHASGGNQNPPRKWGEIRTPHGSGGAANQHRPHTNRPTIRDAPHIRTPHGSGGQHANTAQKRTAQSTKSPGGTTPILHPHHQPPGPGLPSGVLMPCTQANAMVPGSCNNSPHGSAGTSAPHGSGGTSEPSRKWGAERHRPTPTHRPSVRVARTIHHPTANTPPADPPRTSVRGSDVACTELGAIKVGAAHQHHTLTRRPSVRITRHIRTPHGSGGKSEPPTEVGGRTPPARAHAPPPRPRRPHHPPPDSQRASSRPAPDFRPGF